MKIWELDWTEGKQYKDEYYNVIWTVQNGELMSPNGFLIYDTYRTRLLANIEFEFIIDWSKVEVDTKVLVSENGFNWYKRYFSKYEDGKIYCFKYGANSWSITTDNEIISWEYTKLAESEI